MGLIKDIYSPGFYNNFADTVQLVIPSFDKDGFIKGIFSSDFATMEWKSRVKHTSRVFHDFIHADFPEAVGIIERLIRKLRNNNFSADNLVFIFLPDYIETYGLADFGNSVKALEFITQFISCEYAVRPFIIKFGDKMLSQMVTWSLHENASVRRLASEGSRPRLPWAMALPALKTNPKPLLPILENLKNDPSEYVRRSVANNINDISKDHPDFVIDLALRWKGGSKETAAIIKHGFRTLLKQGHADALGYYSLGSTHIDVQDFKVLSPQVRIGESLAFSFSILNRSTSSQTVRLEYGIYYKKAKGHLSKKVFKISEKPYLPNECINITRKQSFKLITTRVFYTGEHKVSIIANGEEKGAMYFIVTA